MRALIVSLLGLGLMACGSTNYGDKYHGTQIEVQGHRGARTVLPENTIPGFEYALDVGVDTLELDMGVTKDNVVIVNHDQKINPKICQMKDGSPVGDNLWVRNMTLKEIKQLDCGSKVNPRFKNQTLKPGTEIPTLDEVFKMVKASKAPIAKKVLFNIETKSDPKNPMAQPKPAEFARLVLKVVKKHKLQDRVTIQSFDHRTLREVKKQAPKIQLAALFEHEPDNWVEATKSAKADIVSPYFKFLSKEEVKTMQAAGLKVIPWTANDASDWADLIELGVDGIITDDPKPLMKMLGRL